MGVGRGKQKMTTWAGHKEPGVCASNGDWRGIVEVIGDREGAGPSA